MMLQHPGSWCEIWQNVKVRHVEREVGQQDELVLKEVDTIIGRPYLPASNLENAWRHRSHTLKSTSFER